MSAKRCRKIHGKAAAKPKTEAEFDVYVTSMKYNEIDAVSDMMRQILINLRMKMKQKNALIACLISVKLQFLK